MPGNLAFRLAKDVELARGDLGVRKRPFAHLHPDGEQTNRSLAGRVDAKLSILKGCNLTLQDTKRIRSDHA
ncbi:MAG: hypothetical protein ACR2PG_22355, partial [Hyphomicrobiaceae bacterium]